MLTPSQAEAGRQGERLAAQFLQKQGFKILRRNYASRLGEIDLIARDGKEIVFVEVKTRTSRLWGEPESAVTPAKRLKLCRAAAAFADRYRLREHPLRFDVVAVLLAEDRPPEFKHYEDAFPLKLG